MTDTYNILLTGAGGFLGRHILKDLIALGHTVYALVRPGRHLDLTDLGAIRLEGSLEDLPPFPKNCHAVIHTAALAGIWGRFEDYAQTNIRGTQHLLNTAIANNVPYFIHTSSPSVVFGNKSLKYADESTPYPEKHYCHYAYTKAKAEQLVLAANSPKIKTVALRPHLIWGPGDNHLLPTLLDSAKAGKLAFVGDKKNRVDFTHVSNASQAHICALKALIEKKPCDGKAYFISDRTSVLLCHHVNMLTYYHASTVVRKTIPFRVAYALGAILEWGYNLLKIEKQPPMTRFLALQLAKDHYFDNSAAKRDLSYEPKDFTIKDL